MGGEGVGGEGGMRGGGRRGGGRLFPPGCELYLSYI